MLTSTGEVVRHRRLWVNEASLSVYAGVRKRIVGGSGRETWTYLRCTRIGRYDPERDILVTDDPGCRVGFAVVNDPLSVRSVTGGWMTLRRWAKRQWFAERV